MNKTCFIFSIIFVLLITANRLAGQQTTFIDKSRFDTTIHPGDNFYLYANGGYFKKMKQSNSSTDTQTSLDDENQIKLLALLKKVTANNYPDGSYEQKLSHFMKSAVDTVTIEQLSIKPIMPTMNKIDAAKSSRELMQVAGELYKDGGVKLYGFEVRPDQKNSKVNIAIFTQAGTTLPFIDKSRYTKTDSISILYRKIHSQLIVSLLKAIGESEETATAKAGRIIDIERRLSATHLGRNADVSLTYNKLSVAKASTAFPNINFQELLKQMGITADTILITNLSYFQTLDSLLVNEPFESLKAKIKFDYLYRTAQYLSNDFLKPYQQFITAYRGAQFNTRDFSYNAMTLFRDLVAQLYVKEYVSPEAKQKLKEIATNIQQTLLQRIERSTRISAHTKANAIKKLQNMAMNMAYPDIWENYDDVYISEHHFFANYISISHHNYKKQIEKIGTPVNRLQWRSTPISTEASYSWEENAIAVHSGILQLPVFDVQAEDAINYSGIGTTIAHEMSHGFDDIGRKYDAEGNLKNWWQKEDDDYFKEVENKMINQYAKIPVYDSLYINAASTFNENFADLYCLILAYEAYNKLQKEPDTVLVDGFTSDQRFFINYAIIRGAYEPQTQTAGFADRFKAASVNATHSPQEIRINGPLANFEPFYKAFNVTEKNKMYIKPSERISFW